MHLGQPHSARHSFTECQRRQGYWRSGPARNASTFVKDVWLKVSSAGCASPEKDEARYFERAAEGKPALINTLLSLENPMMIRVSWDTRIRPA